MQAVHQEREKITIVEPSFNEVLGDYPSESLR